MVPIGAILGMYWGSFERDKIGSGYIGTMEKKMEASIMN